MFDMFKQFLGGGKDYFGSKVDVPDLPGMGDILKEGAAANLAALPGIKDWAGQINAFNQSEVSKMLEQVLPGFTGGLASVTTNAAALARGEIPSDVQSAVVNSAAARAVRGGYGGTGMGRNLVSRDLGITSLAATEAGQQRLQSLGGFARAAFPVFDFSTAFFNPAQMLDYTYSKFQRDLLQAQVDAAPDPVARGRADQEMALFGMILSVYSGGPGYQGSQNYGGLGGGGGGPTGGGSAQGYTGSSYGGYGGGPSRYGTAADDANNANTGAMAGLMGMF